MSEVKEFKFDKMIVGGYDVSQVNAFVEEARSTVAELREQIATLTQKMGVLANKIKEYQDDEMSIKEALKSAQKTAASVIKAAEEKSRELFERAQSEAAERIYALKQEIADYERRAENVRRMSGEMVSELIARYSQQIVLLENGLLGEKPAAVAKPQEQKGGINEAELVPAEVTLASEEPEEEPAEETEPTGESQPAETEPDAAAPRDAVPVFDEIAAAIAAQE